MRTMRATDAGTRRGVTDPGLPARAADEYRAARVSLEIATLQEKP
jgi:hypothetical protein